MKNFIIRIAILAIPILLLLTIWHTAQNPLNAAGTTFAPCVNGLAGGIYPCHNVDLLSHLPLDEIGGGSGALGNDHWGWTDPDTNRDYVIYGLTDGVSFIDITERGNPVYLGKLPAHYSGQTSIWWDVKVNDNYAFIVGDVPSTNGLQVFDLTQLRTITTPAIFTETAHYAGFGSGHNLWINGETDMAYVIRTSMPMSSAVPLCNTLNFIDISDPLNPAAAGIGCLVDDPLDDLASDTECIIYDGPDVEYAGREICFTGSDKTMSISDVTDKQNPVVITGTMTYPGLERAHQGALTPDRRYWLMSDVFDEPFNGHNTRTYVWDVADLDMPLYLGFYEANSPSRDHNIYIVDNIAYEANWNSGLRVLDIRGLPSTDFEEVAYFDIVPETDSPSADGAWSNYPWWGDGVVTVSSTAQGLFVLRVKLHGTAYLPAVFGTAGK